MELIGYSKKEKANNHVEVKVEWQLTSPFDPSADMEGEEGGQEYVSP